MSARAELRRWYEEATRAAYKEAEAIVAEAVKEAEARRRFHVDSHGRTAITYVDGAEEEL
jgi:hypothetical protein